MIYILNLLLTEHLSGCLGQAEARRGLGAIEQNSLMNGSN